MDQQQPDPAISQQRQELMRRVEQIKARPRPGALARALRERCGISVEEMAEEVGVEPKAVAVFEQSGWVIELIAVDECLACFLDNVDEDPTDQIVGDYVHSLRANQDEEKLLRRNLATELREALANWIPPEWWEKAENRLLQVQDESDFFLGVSGRMSLNLAAAETRIPTLEVAS